MLGWMLWGLLTALTLAAGYAAALAIAPDRTLPHRVAVALTLQLALVLFDMNLCGALNLFTRAPLALVAIALCGTLAFAIHRGPGVAAVLARARADLQAPRAWWRAGFSVESLWLLALIPAVLALGVTLQVVWWLPTLAWDAMWYHVPMVGYTIQNHGFDWIDTHITYIAGYPRNVELLATWNCVFPMSSRLDDSGQLPFLLLGAAVAAAWLRDLGCSRSASAGIGAAFVALPPVFVQASQSEVDVAGGALLAAVFYFLAKGHGLRDRWLAILPLGMYVGSKYTGAFHALLLAPWFLWRAVQAVREDPRRLRRVGEIALSIVAALSLGIFKYVQNFVRMGNPLWPIRTKLPFGIVLPGPDDPAQMAYTGLDSYFFSRHGDFTRFLQSWFRQDTDYETNVHEGGYGHVTYLMLACLAVVLIVGLVQLARRRDAAKWIMPPLLFAIAIVVPAAWWPRYTLAGAVGGLAAVGLVGMVIKPAPLRALLALAFVGLVGWGYGRARYTGHAFYPDMQRAFGQPWPEGAAVVLWRDQWPQDQRLAYDRETRDGDIVTYDDAAYFLSIWFADDYRTQVTYVPHDRDVGAYVEHVTQLGARWASVRRQPGLDQAAAAHGWKMRFDTGYARMFQVRP